LVVPLVNNAITCGLVVRAFALIGHALIIQFLRPDLQASRAALEFTRFEFVHENRKYAYESALSATFWVPWM
jgi:hypothetical protein